MLGGAERGGQDRAPDHTTELTTLRDQQTALEERIQLLEKAAAEGALTRTDEALAATLAVVQAVGRGQDPTSLPASDQVGFCRATGWTVRDLAMLGQSIRGVEITRQAAVAECKQAGSETPTEEDVLATEPGKEFRHLLGVVQNVNQHLDQGRWAEARSRLLEGLGAREPAPPTEGE